MADIMRSVNLLIIIAVAVVSIVLWALANQPHELPPWPKSVQGFSFSPFRADQDAIDHILPSPEQINQDLELLQGKTSSVRTYSTDGTLAEVPRLASAHGIKVTVGAWIDNDYERNEREILKAIELAKTNPNVERIIVGNEAVLHNYLPVAQLVAYIDRVRSAVHVPVSTAEPWHVWTVHPDLVRHVDFIAVHMLPYWEKQSVDTAVSYVKDKMNLLGSLFPGKPLVIGEVGWPSNGRTRGGAVASVANQAKFLRDFLSLAETSSYSYFIMEAFDQPWKGRSSEGAIGAYWGVYDVDRVPKFSWTAPIVGVPNWTWLAGLSVILAIIVFATLLIDGRHLGTRGRGFLAVIAYCVATAVVWVAYDYSNQYFTPVTFIIGALLILGMVGVIVVLLTEAHEWAEARWSVFRRRAFTPITFSDTSKLPFVSIHLPCYNEPPEMVKETLDALAKLEYENYEVVVVDNNTKDAAVWRPVEAYCARLGSKFRFFHVDPLAGFKAGALNFALAQTDSRATVIAVIDSDYVVSSDWLKDLAPQFNRDKIAIVQAPQDYRDGQQNAFKQMCYSEYAGFFHIGMVTRNDRNAIIQHGTMTLIRRSVLNEVGGWAQWCITEDAELGLRVFERGYEAAYVARSYGRGLMPDTFIDFKKQRFRWAYGAMQILRAHGKQLFGKAPTCLTTGQRYHFVAGWLPWIADGLNFVFNALALMWSLGMILFPGEFDPPLIVFSLLPLALFFFKTSKQLYLYQSHVRSGWRNALAATVAGLALSHTISKAMLLGLFTKNKPFFRTPKMADRLSLRTALLVVREELLLALAFLIACVGVAMQQGTESLDVLLWIAMLVVQVIPYCAAIFMSLLAAKPERDEVSVEVAA